MCRVNRRIGLAEDLGRCSKNRHRAGQTSAEWKALCFKLLSF